MQHLQSWIRRIATVDDLDSPVTIRDIANAFPGRLRGKRMSYKVVLRYCLRGYRGVKLDSFTLGGRRLSTWRSVLRFIAETNGCVYRGIDTGPSTDPGAAASFLEALGIPARPAWDPLKNEEGVG